MLNIVHGSGARRGRAADRPSGRRPRRVHRLAGDRADRLPRRRRAADAGVVRARRQVAVRGLRRLRPRRRRGDRRLPVRQRRARSASPERGCWSRSAVLEPFLERFRARVAEIVVGDPRLADDDLRPADPPGRARARHRARGARARARARACCSAASRSAGSTTRRRCSPTCPPTAEILRTEVFGPVLTLQAFADEAQAIAMANDRTTASRRPCSPARPRARSASARRSSPVPCGSTASTCATWRRRSAARATRASAARAAATHSTSTATSRRSVSERAPSRWTLSAGA